MVNLDPGTGDGGALITEALLSEAVLKNAETSATDTTKRAEGLTTTCRAGCVSSARKAARARGKLFSMAIATPGTRTIIK